MPKKYDVIVVGGGASGMMAAGRAAELGAKVLLLEKNNRLGEKLLITGGGRCNITNAEFDVRKMVAKYGPKGKALFGSFSRFGVEDALQFFNERGLPTKVEAEKRAFPESNKAEDVWKVLLKYLEDGKVEICYNSPVKKILTEYNAVVGIKTKEKIYTAKSYVVATGGKSRPETGSTGDGFKWMITIGHTVEEQDAALVPIKIKEGWVKKLSGLSFKNAKLTIFQGGKKQDSLTGKLLFTHFGISGPMVLNLSKQVAEIFKYDPVTLLLDLYPNTDTGTLDALVLESVNKSLNKKIKNNLGDVIPIRMIPSILELAKIDPEIACNALTKGQRAEIVKLLKGLTLTVSGFLGTEKAIITSGGVVLNEIDFKTMQSKLFSNLFLAGDLLNFDRPTGGFSLQICWTTGFLAGENSASL